MPVRLGYAIVYVDDVRSSIDFYKAAFGLEERFVSPEGDYGELDTGATTLAMASNELAEDNLAAAGGFTRIDASAPPPAVSITLVTDDVEGTLRDAVAAGARPYVDPVAKPWGQTVAYLIDPNGLLIELGTPVQS